MKLIDAAEVAPKIDIPSVRELDSVFLPPLEVALARMIEPVSVSTIVEPEDPRGQLERVVTKSLAVLERILDEKPTGEDRARIMSLQLQAAQTGINSQLKVDESAMKARQVDMLPRILEMVEATIKANPKVIEHETSTLPPASV